MKTRLEQILEKINLSKVINMNYVIWETSIDERTVEKLQGLNYEVSEHPFGFYISW